MRKILFFLTGFLFIFNLCFSFQSFVSIVFNNKFSKNSLIANLEQTSYDLGKIPAKYFFKVYYKNGKYLFRGNIMQPYFEKADLKKIGADEKKYVPKEKLDIRNIFFDGSKYYMELNEKKGVMIDFSKIPEFIQTCDEEAYKKIKTEKINNFSCDVYEAECLFKKLKLNLKTYINKDNIRMKNLIYENDKLTRETVIKDYKINANFDENMLKPTDGIIYDDMTNCYIFFAELDKAMTENYIETGNTQTSQNMLNNLIAQELQKSFENQLKKAVPQTPEDLLKKSLLGW